MLFEGDPDRSHKEQLRRNNEKDSKRLIKQYQLCKMVDKTDKKRFYNRVKSMVECEMKANEHLFVDKCPMYVCTFYCATIDIYVYNKLFICLHIIISFKRMMWIELI